MNKTRRTALRKLAIKLKEINYELENICADEEDYFDNIPENLKSGERANESEEAIGLMQDTSIMLEDVIINIEDLAYRCLYLL